MSVIDHCKLEDWNSKAVVDYHMLPGHIEKVNHILNQHMECEICDDVDLAPELVTSLSSHARFQDRELRIIASLQSTLHIARTFGPITEPVRFIILDEKVPGRIIFEFEWDSRPTWTWNFGSPFPHFLCKVSSDGRLLILVGPTEVNNDSRTLPTTKLLDCSTWTLETLEFKNPCNDLQLWPANVEFDPRPNHSHRLTMIATSFHCHNVLRSDLCQGFLMEYNFDKRKFRYSEERPLSSAFLEYIKEGQQLLVLNDHKMEEKRIVYIYNSDTLEVVIEINLTSIKTNSHWLWACTHVIPVCSVCYTYLSLVLWSYDDFKRWINTDVITLKLPHIADHLFSLQHACRITIRHCLRGNSVDKLTLPRKLKDFLDGNPQNFNGN